MCVLVNKPQRRKCCASFLFVKALNENILKCCRLSHPCRLWSPWQFIMVRSTAVSAEGFKGIWCPPSTWHSFYSQNKSFTSQHVCFKTNVMTQKTHTHTHWTESCNPINSGTICAVQPASLCVLCLGILHRVLSKYAGQALRGSTSD